MLYYQSALRLLAAPYSQCGEPSDANIYQWHKRPCSKKRGRQKVSGGKQSVLSNLRRVRRQRMKDHVRELKNKPCADCDKMCPYFVMDFDHREGEIKLFEIADYLATRVVSTMRNWMLRLQNAMWFVRTATASGRRRGSCLMRAQRQQKRLLGH